MKGMSRGFQERSKENERNSVEERDLAPIVLKGLQAAWGQHGPAVPPTLQMPALLHHEASVHDLRLTINFNLIHSI